MEEEQRRMIMEVNCGRDCEWNETEREFAEFLLNLSELFLKAQKKSREKFREPFPVKWGKIKFARSRTRRITKYGGGVKTTVMVKKAPATPSQRGVNNVAAQIPSPSTPFCFSSSSESDDNPAPISQHLRKRDEQTQTMEEQSEWQNGVRTKTHEQGENSSLAARHIFRPGAKSSGELNQTVVTTPPPPPHVSQLMLNPTPMTRSGTLNLELHNQSPNPVMYCHVVPSGTMVNLAGPISNDNGFPKQETFVGLIQRNPSQEYARDISQSQAQAQAKAVDARRNRRMVINTKRLQKLQSKPSSGTVRCL